MTMFAFQFHAHQEQARVLRGDVRDGEVVKVNGFVIQALRDLNIYVVQEQLLDFMHDMDEDSDLIHTRSWADYLIEEDIGSIVVLEDQECERVYDLFPYSPSVKDTFYVTRLLERHLEELTINDIYLLSLYRTFEINGQNIKKVTDKLDLPSIQALIKHITPFHQQMVEQHLNYVKAKDE